MCLYLLILPGLPLEDDLTNGLHFFRVNLYYQLDPGQLRVLQSLLTIFYSLQLTLIRTVLSLLTIPEFLVHFHICADDTSMIELVVRAI
jgi:hypothetical protein